jgi:hypothetical protein
MTDPNATGLVLVATKKKRHSATLRRELASRDAASLEFYFCDGKSMFAKSTMGGMLERADMFSHATERCWGCLDEAGVSLTGGWCKGCGGSGFIAVEITFDKDDSNVNAWPTAEPQETMGFEPSHEALQLYGRVSRRLAVVASYGGASLVDVLDDYHGDIGAKWGRRREGRIFAVYARTLAGRRLIVQTCKGQNIVAMAPDERLRVLVEVQKRQPKNARGDLLEQAAVQARKLYGDACAAWNFSAMLVRESPAEAIARALRTAAKHPEPVALPTKRERPRFDPAANRPAMEIFGKGKDGFANMRRKAEEEQAALEALEVAQA